jgi:hypothetical protein
VVRLQATSIRRGEQTRFLSGQFCNSDPRNHPAEAKGPPQATRFFHFELRHDLLSTLDCDRIQQQCAIRAQSTVFETVHPIENIYLGESSVAQLDVQINGKKAAPDPKQWTN